MTLKRSKVTMHTGIAVQIQEMSWQEASEQGGAHPHDSFWIRTTGGGIIDVRRGDLLIDENEIDSLTGSATQYRVFGRPRPYYQTFTQIPAEQLLGT